jgi:hypothetical protein
MTASMCGRPTSAGSPCRVLTRSGPCQHHAPESLRAKRERQPAHMPGCRAVFEHDWGRPHDVLCLGPAGHAVEFVCVGCGITSVWLVADGPVAS